MVSAVWLTTSLQYFTLGRGLWFDIVIEIFLQNLPGTFHLQCFSFDILLLRLIREAILVSKVASLIEIWQFDVEFKEEFDDSEDIEGDKIF